MKYGDCYHNYVADPEVLRHANETKVIPLLRQIPGFVDSVISYLDELQSRGYPVTWAQTFDSWESNQAKFEHPAYLEACAIVHEMFLLKKPAGQHEDSDSNRRKPWARA